MSPVSEHMTFDDLSELYRVEMNGSSISQVRRDLFRAMADLLTRLRGEYEKQLAIDPDSVMCEGAEHRRKSAERLCKEVVRIRATKICNMAFLGALGSRNPTDMLTEEEKAYYYKVLEASKCHLSEVDRLRGKRVTVATHIDEIPARDMPAEPAMEAEEPREEQEFVPPEDEIPPEEEPPRMEDAPAENPEPPIETVAQAGAADAASEKAPASEPSQTGDMPLDDIPMDDFEDDIPDPLDSFGPDVPPEEWDEPEPPISQEDIPREQEDESLRPVLIRILEDLPEFAGPSRDYALCKEDVVTMPKAMAEVLVNTGKAVAISPSRRRTWCRPGTPGSRSSSSLSR
ncbi:MAG: hypothetical protein IKR86_08785 [Candidatus Methanomethylophilaceae archaeon]|nr:hypothetical protein [Candidatus Methanomethylophilaceae archaeon]